MLKEMEKVMVSLGRIFNDNIITNEINKYERRKRIEKFEKEFELGEDELVRK